MPLRPATFHPSRTLFPPRAVPYALPFAHCARLASRSRSNYSIKTLHVTPPGMQEGFASPGVDWTATRIRLEASPARPGSRWGLVSQALRHQVHRLKYACSMLGVGVATHVARTKHIQQLLRT